MKKIILFCAISIATSCYENGESNEQTFEPTLTPVTPADVGNDMASSTITSTSENIEDRIEELKKLKPIANEKLQDFYPSDLLGLNRSNVSVTNVTGYSSGSAAYTGNNGVEIQVMIFDCAGEAGANFYGMSYLSKLNAETEDEKGYQKVIAFDDSKAIETYDKQTKEYSLSFLTAERFWVSVTSSTTSPANVKKFIQALDLQKLEDIK